MPAPRPERLALAILLAVAAASAGASELGTLFHSPDERARLEKMRRGEAVEIHGPATSKPEVTGFVRRSDGRSTVWINGAPVVVEGTRGEKLLDPGLVRQGDEDSVRFERTQPGEVKR